VPKTNVELAQILTPKAFNTKAQGRGASRAPWETMSEFMNGTPTGFHNIYATPLGLAIPWFDACPRVAPFRLTLGFDVKRLRRRARIPTPKALHTKT
jgi:hypothetical protein